MIRSVRVQNYRCLRDIEVELRPLTVLVGANASGKSSLMAALAVKCGPDDVLGKQANGRVSVSLQRDADRVGWTWDKGLIATSGSYPRVQLLQLDIEQLRAHNQLQEMRMLERTGHGLANLFATVSRKQRDVVAQQFCSLLPMFADVDARPSGSGQHRLVFQDRWRSDVWYEPGQVSDGSILVLAYLLLQFQNPAPDLVAIEEPERGLHPYLMQELIKVLRALTTGQFDKEKPVQIVLATHSAQLLDYVEPEEVRFFMRDKLTGEARIETAPTGSESWSKVFSEYSDSLGSLWLSGGLGGAP